jgi:hypothetical protein
MPTEEETAAAATKVAEDAKASAGPKVDELSGAQVKQAFNFLLQQNRTLTTELDMVKGRIEEQKNQRVVSAAPSDEREVDVETMSNGQLMNHIFKKIETAYVQPAAERIASAEGGTKSAAIRQELKEVAERHPEFWEFKNEVKEVLEAYPELNISDAFALAKTRAPETVRRLDEARGKERMDKEKKAADDRKKSFGGLLPTSGKTASSARMSAKDAAEAAWEELDLDEHLAAISAG